MNLNRMYIEDQAIHVRGMTRMRLDLKFIRVMAIGELVGVFNQMPPGKLLRGIDKFLPAVGCERTPSDTTSG